MLSEFSDNECELQAVKGAGIWSRSLIEKGRKPLLSILLFFLGL